VDPSEHEQPGPALADPWRDAAIAIVDDESANGRLLATILTRSGYANLTIMTDPVDFVDRYDDLQPDLVLLDLMMPRLDGIAVLRRIRAMTPVTEFVPVLMLTADTGADTMQRALSNGVDDFLTKPFDPVEVQLRIANLLRTRRLSKEISAYNLTLEREVAQRTQDLQMFRDVLETVPQPVVIEDPATGTVVYTNTAISEALSLEERTLNPWTSGGLGALAPDVVAGHQPVARVEDTLRRTDGDERPVEILIHPIQHGDTRLLVGLARDITDRIATQRVLEETLEQQQRAADELRRVDGLKEAFLTAISHEVRTPLTVISGVAQILLQRSDQITPEQALNLLQRLSANAQRLETMLVDLLDLNQILTGQKTQLRLEPVDLGALVRGCVDAAGLDDRPLSVTTTEILIDADRTKLERAVSAILANIVKHTPPKTTVAVTLKDHDPARIMIADNGPGIPAELREDVFEPFLHGPTTAAHSPGTGTGLTLARTLVEAHHGTVTLADTPGGGATFTIELPRRHQTSRESQ
jgi:signal transduction histidine kinase